MKCVRPKSQLSDELTAEVRDLCVLLMGRAVIPARDVQDLMSTRRSHVRFASTHQKGILVNRGVVALAQM